MHSNKSVVGYDFFLQQFAETYKDTARYNNMEFDISEFQGLGTKVRKLTTLCRVLPEHTPKDKIDEVINRLEEIGKSPHYSSPSSDEVSSHFYGIIKELIPNAIERIQRAA
jgi:hypothetical protein